MLYWREKNNLAEFQMNNKKISILFITEASLTGAPILLAEILNVLHASANFDITVLIKRHDVLESEFAKYGKTYVLKGKLYRHKQPPLHIKVLRAINTFFRKRSIYPKLRGTDVIISNTITNGNILRDLSFLNTKVVCYVHELANLIRTWKPQSDIAESFERTHLYMVPSNAVQNNLITNHSIAKEKIRLFNTYLSVNVNADEQSKAGARKKFCEKYGIAPASFLVVGMGTADERKGIGLFVETAAALTHQKHIIFVWIGGFATPKMERDTKQKIADSGLSEKIIFTGQLPHDCANLLPFHLFLLSSREDPYPLVVLEAAALKIPAACFKESGGITDFVSDGAGWIVPGFSTKAMADVIANASEQPQQLRAAGEKAYQKFSFLHNNRERVVTQFNAIINDVLKQPD
jgi:glycosyltransferase involved in cell wall biosynthesis